MKIPLSLLKIFWLVALVIVLMVGWRLPLLLLTVLIVFFLAAPLWREFSRKSDLDERQVFISHFSSHLAFYVFLGLLLFTLLYLYAPQHKNPEPHWYALLLIPLVVKFLVSLFQNYGPLRASRWIGYFFGFSWLLFAVFSHGASIASILEALPFLIIILVAWYSRKNALMARIVFILLAGGMLLFFNAWINFNLFVRLLMYSLLPLPLFVSGVALIIAWGKKDQEYFS